jgi:spore coat protein JB
MSKSEQAKAMQQLQELSFQIQEAVMYLDGHPDNSAALRYYHRVSKAYRDAAQRYEEMYGPLTVCGCGGGSHEGTDGGANDCAAASERNWVWVNGPWPWESTFPNNAGNDSGAWNSGECGGTEE